MQHDNTIGNKWTRDAILTRQFARFARALITSFPELDLRLTRKQDSTEVHCLVANFSEIPITLTLGEQPVQEQIQHTEAEIRALCSS